MQATPPFRRSPARRHISTIRKSSEGSFDNPLFSEQFKSVLATSLQNNKDALLGEPAVPREPRIGAAEEVLKAALSHSRHSLAQLLAWRDQMDKQIVSQAKQVERIEFALHKVRGDSAQLRTLQKMLDDQYGSDKDGD